MPKQIIYETQQALAGTLASSLAGDLRQSVKKQGHAFLVLPGGTSPRGLIAELARHKKDWQSIIVTTTDERCVPVESEHSNAGQILRLGGMKPLCLWEDSQPRDVVALPWPTTATILGMGLDGHIASLFSELDVRKDGGMIIETNAPVEPYKRVSLTLEALLNTQRLILLVMGAKKRALCDRVLQGEQQDTPLAHLINAAGSRLTLHITKS